METKKPIAAGTLAAPEEVRKSLVGTKRFVLTSAQNNTYVHEKFLKSLLTMVQYRKAKLLVGTFTYNKSGFQNGTKEDDGIWFDPKIKHYVNNDSTTLADGLVWCGELDVLPTAVKPLSGFENYTHDASGVIPHAKMQMVSLPRVKGDDPRFLYTTGTVTKRNYIQRKAGQKAEFHHVFGALYVEIDSTGEWFVRQIVADKTGAFYDLTTKFDGNEITEGHPVAAVNLGDIHVEHTDSEVAYGAWNSKNCMLSVLKPEYTFVHDLTDFKARNHHNIRDPYFLAKMLNTESGGRVEHDMQLSARFLSLVHKHSTPVVVESNHHQAFTRWLREADIRQDPINARFFHASNAKVFDEIAKGHADFNVYAWVLRGMLEEINPAAEAVFLDEDEKFYFKDIEFGMHGHRGPNGSRGSAANLKNIGRRCNLGHSHAAGIIDGCYVAGVSAKLDLGYNAGPSSWSHSHIVTYSNGKRSIITQRGRKWRA